MSSERFAHSINKMSIYKLHTMKSNIFTDKSKLSLQRLFFHVLQFHPTFLSSIDLLQKAKRGQRSSRMFETKNYQIALLLHSVSVPPAEKQCFRFVRFFVTESILDSVVITTIRK